MCGLGVVVASSVARADDQRLQLMRETTSYTDVIDAFDDNDPFDLNAHLGYSRLTDRGTIQREYTSGAGARKRSSVADSERVASTLTFGLDVGLYKDLMAYVRLPLIVGDTRSLSLPSGKSSADVKTRLTDPYDVAPGTGQLFSVPFDSPTRAGFDYVGIGGAWAILNQTRQTWLPNWVLMIEGRRAVGIPLKPCKLDKKDNTTCGSSVNKDLDGNGVNDGTNPGFAGKSAGSSRGVSAISVETRLSRRYRYAEPYGGFGLLVEWASTAKKYFNPGGDLKGTINSMPARQVQATLGTAVIPWENRARFQRFALDLRLNATYFSAGHDYSALYDALGTSGHAELARPNFEGVKDVPDPNAAGSLKPCSGSVTSNCYVGAKVPFYGLTDVQSHLKYGFRAGLEMQAAQYVRFNFGFGLGWITAHALTAADACNPHVTDASRSEGYRGSTCLSKSGSGITNPAHRPTIDLPGRRFWMTSELMIDLYASATAQF
jgi:hypothetical protein